MFSLWWRTHEALLRGDLLVWLGVVLAPSLFMKLVEVIFARCRSTAVSASLPHHVLIEHRGHMSTRTRRQTVYFPRPAPATARRRAPGPPPRFPRQLPDLPSKNQLPPERI